MFNNNLNNFWGFHPAALCFPQVRLLHNWYYIIIAISAGAVLGDNHSTLHHHPDDFYFILPISFFSPS